MEWLDSSRDPVIKRTILRDEIKDYILEAILNSDLKPGERIVETQVAKHLGVSQAPVREALRELEHIGVLRSKPYKGSFVKELSSKELLERYTVRATLEETAIRLVVPNITHELLTELENFIHRMLDAAKMKNSRELITLDVAFHRLLLRESKNDYLLSVWENINPASWTLITTHHTKADLIDLAKRHYGIIDALKSGDQSHAGYMIRKHIEELAPEKHWQ